MPWNETDLGLLRSLVDRGEAPKRIRAHLGNRYTPGAIAGKIWRYVQSKPSTAHVPRRVIVRVGRPRRPIVEAPPTAPAAEPGPPRNLVSFRDLLDNGCRWPVSGSGMSTMYCGTPTDRPPYCDECRHLGTEKPGQRDAKPKITNRSMSFNS